MFGKYEEIPEDWERVKLIEKCSKKPEYGAGESAAEKDLKLSRYIRITDLNDDGSLRNEEWKSISNDAAKDYILNEGDILFARTGATVGKSYLYEKKDGKCAFAGYLIRFVPDQKKLDLKFLFQNIHSIYYWKWLKSIQTWGVQPNVNAEQYSNMPILLPPIKEQQKIASILSNVDNLIDSYGKVIASTKVLKRGLMQKLLTKGIGHTKFKKIKWLFGKEIEIPEEWEVKSLSEISENGLRNGLFKKSEDFGFGVPLVNVSDLFSETEIRLHNLERVNTSEKEIEQFGLKEGDIFFCRSSLVEDGIGHSNIVLSLPEPSVFECHVMMFRANRLVNPKFLFYYTRIFLFKQFLTSIAMTLTMTTIRQPDLELATILVPNLEEQNQILSIITNFDYRIESLEFKKSQLENLKKGLMQKLLTGQIRV